MNWNERFPQERQPTMEDIADYLGEAKELWHSLVSYFDASYQAKPKLSYSGCSMKPGWNVKFQKSGQSFGTIYPLKDAFDVMIVVSYKLDSIMEAALPMLSEPTANLYRSAGDYMKMGKWMMLHVGDRKTLSDYETIVSIKLPPKSPAHP